MSASANVTDAMVHAFEDAYCKNWEAQRCAPEGTQELGTFFATRAGLSAALSAQPSPGGQGDGLVESLVQVMNAQYDGLGYLPADVLGVLNMAVEALAARQPVCATVKDFLTVGGGQPVGEPVAWMTHHDEPMLFPTAAEAAAYCEDDEQPVPLFRSPAQAVDLGPVRALLQRRIWQWRSHLPADTGAPGTREIETKADRDYNNDVRIYREGIAVMEEVLAKVDSQAVGK